MGRWVTFLLALGLLAAPARAEVDVRVSGERVDVTATAAPLAEVLDQLARQTGMEIVYEGTPPRQRVTLALEGRSAVEAVQGILEGQGLNYALVADPSGRGVQTLLLAGPVGKGGSSPAPPARPAPRARRPVIPPGAGPEAMDPDFADIEDEEPFEEPDFAGEQPFDDPALGDEPNVEGSIETPPGVPTPVAPPPAAAPLPFPGGQPQVYPASPFTPQPFTPQPFTAAPPGPAEPAESGENAEEPPE